MGMMRSLRSELSRWFGTASKKEHRASMEESPSPHKQAAHSAHIPREKQSASSKEKPSKEEPHPSEQTRFDADA